MLLLFSKIIRCSGNYCHTVGRKPRTFFSRPPGKVSGTQGLTSGTASVKNMPVFPERTRSGTGPLTQRKSAILTRWKSLVQIQHGPPPYPACRKAVATACFSETASGFLLLATFCTDSASARAPNRSPSLSSPWQPVGTEPIWSSSTAPRLSSLAARGLCETFLPCPINSADAALYMSKTSTEYPITGHRRAAVRASNRATPWRATEKAPDAFQLEGGRPRPPKNKAGEHPISRESDEHWEFLVGYWIFDCSF